MAKTGPQKIPGASQAYFYGTGRYSGSDMEVNCGVVHTTEGRSLPSYNGGAMAPTVTGVPDISARKIRWYQHFDVDESARALANKLGGVETNTANVLQIELVGTCDDKYRTTWSGAKAGVDYLHWPTAPDWALTEVAWLVRWLNANHGIPLTCVKDWLAYGKDSRRPGITPASYGASPARMSMATWRNFKGWCGHQHVPENDHGDPGAMDFARVIQLAKGDSAPTTPAVTPAPAPVEEDTVLKALNEANAIDVHLSGAWLPLAFKDEGSLLAGPVPALNITVHLYLDVATHADTKIQGVFYLTNPDGSSPSNYLVTDHRGGGGHQFHHSIPVPTGKKLWFQARAITPDGRPATLLHRIASGTYWATA